MIYSCFLSLHRTTVLASINPSPVALCWIKRRWIRRRSTGIPTHDCFPLLSSVNSSSRSNTKFLSPATCPSSPWTSGPTNGFGTSTSSNDLNNNGDSHSTSALNTSFHFNNKSLSDETDYENGIHVSSTDLQSSSKDGRQNPFHRAFELTSLSLSLVSIPLQI